MNNDEKYQTYQTRVRVRCEEPDCSCDRLINVEAKILSRTKHLLEQPAEICPGCGHPPFQHKPLGEVPYARSKAG
jgi:hypothetical protein